MSLSAYPLSPKVQFIIYSCSPTTTNDFTDWYLAQQYREYSPNTPGNLVMTTLHGPKSIIF